MRPQPSHYFNYCVLTIFSLVLLAPLMLGRTLYWGDISLYFEPMAAFARNEFLQGHIPLWNPYVLSGQPYLGNPQMAVFYPPAWLLACFPSRLFLSVMSVTHLTLCGLFTYKYLCHWSRHRLSALVGGILYMGSSCLVSRLQFPSMTQTAAYFPLMLLAIDRCIERPGRKNTLMLAGIVAFTVLAGHPQMAYLILLSALFYSIIRVLHHFRNIRKQSLTIRKRSIVATLSSGFLLGLALTSAQILPCIQLLLVSPRGEMTAAQANRFVFEPSHLLTLIFPNFFGHPANADYWGGGNAWEPSIFMGWLPLVLTIVGVKWTWRRRRTRFWTILGLFGIWTSFGNSGGLYWLAFKLIPGISSFHDPARFLFLTTFSIVILSAAGLDRYLEYLNRDIPTLRWAVLLITILPLWWYGKDWNPTQSQKKNLMQPQIITSLKRSIPADTRIYLPAHDLLWRRFITDGYNDYETIDIDNPKGYLSTLIPNLNMNWKLPSASGYEPVPILAPCAIDGLARTAMRRNEPNFSRLVGLMHGGVILLPASSHLYDPRMNLMQIYDASGKQLRGQLNISLNKDVAPLAWIVRHERHVDGKMRIEAALCAPDFFPQSTVIISGQQNPKLLELEWGQELETSRHYHPAVVHNVSNTSLSIDADCGPNPGILVISITDYPGWHAAIDGHPATISRADGAYMAVYTPAGKSHIELNYSPDIYRIGLYLTCLAAALTIFLWLSINGFGYKLNRAYRAGGND